MFLREVEVCWVPTESCYWFDAEKKDFDTCENMRLWLLFVSFG